LTNYKNPPNLSLKLFLSLYNLAKEVMKMKVEVIRRVLVFLSEIFSLTHLKRSGWRRFGIPDELRESVADHVFGVAHIALILAYLEKVPRERWGDILLMALIHDNPETRLGDLDRIATLYIKRKRATQQALKDQVATLPNSLKTDLLNLSKELESDSKEAQIVKDADILDFALHALILAQRGYKTRESAQNALAELNTKSAKAILKAALKEENLATLWTQDLELAGDPR